MNEWNLALREMQFATIVAMIRENFKEVNRVVNEDVWPHCTHCGGFHLEGEICDAEWLHVRIGIADANFTLHKTLHAPEMNAKIRLEQLEMILSMKTSDAMDIDVSIDVLSIEHAGLELVRQAVRDKAVPQIGFHMTSNWTDSVYHIHINHSHVIVLPTPLYLIYSFFSWPFWDERPMSELRFVPPPLLDWKLMEVHVMLGQKCSLYLLEDFSFVNTTRYSSICYDEVLFLIFLL